MIFKKIFFLIKNYTKSIFILDLKSENFYQFKIFIILRFLSFSQIERILMNKLKYLY